YQTIHLPGGAILVSDQRNGAPDGADTVSNVESFRFADRTYLLAELNHAPVVTVSDVHVVPGQTLLAASSLFSYADNDNDAATLYQFWDATSDAASGYFTVNGVTQAANTVIQVSAAQLANTKFQAGAASAHIFMRAFDGIAWSQTSTWDSFDVLPPMNHAPKVTVSTVNVVAGQTLLQASSLFSVTDADNDAIT